MSLPIWTRRAVATETRSLKLRLWRAVEAQHLVATMALVDDAGEQALLEDILEASKPPLPAECRHLHYLLQTPFRYPSPVASRFRRAFDAGVWYGAEQRATSLAELGWWRWRFVADSDGLERLPPVAHTVFRAQVRGPALDLLVAPWIQAHERWMAPDDYEACHALAERARDAGIDLIRYASVRDPQHGACAAVLACRAFDGGLLDEQNWWLTVTAAGASWTRFGGDVVAAQSALSFAFA
ncbi:MAG: RES family NAD+ phosphorylase [Pseudomonadota bacterium]|nr:RES family NAD+ phosphorylase [Pseudomonadota bacterium]